MKKETKIAICLGIIFGVIKCLLPSLAWLWTEILLPLGALIVIIFIKSIPYLVIIGILNKVFGKTEARKIIWLVWLISLFK